MTSRTSGPRRVTRRRVAGAAGVAAVLGAACGRTASPAGGVSDQARGAPSKAPVTVTVWHAANAITDQGRELLRAFEAAHPQITVDWQVVEWAGAGQMLSRLPVAAASGDLPDSFRGHWSNFGNIIHQGWVRPLDAQMRQARLTRRDFTPSTWELSSYRGQIYAMPSYAYTLAPWWNKDLLRRSGLDVERLPATFDQVMDASVRLWRNGQAGQGGAADRPGAATDGGQGPGSTTLGWSHRTSTPGHFVFLFGAQVYDAARQRVTPDHPGVIEALQWLIELDKRQGGYQRVEQVFAAGGVNPFYTGRLAVTVNQPRSFPSLAAQAPSLDLGVSLYPSKRGSLQEVAHTSIQAEMLPITRESKHPDETWTLLKWLYVERAAEWASRTLNTPCLLGALDAFYEQVAQSFGGDRRLVPYLGVYKEMSRRGTAHWPTIPTTNEYLAAFTAAWHEVLQEKVTAEAAMKELARRQQLELEQALRAG
jgi:multiple sugar transport system substrate-binding protein